LDVLADVDFVGFILEAELLESDTDLLPVGCASGVKEDVLIFGGSLALQLLHARSKRTVLGIATVREGLAIVKERYLA